MEEKRVTKFKWFWAWQDEKEESWLENMSEKGYHLASVKTPGFYTFIVTEPRKHAYRLDYQTFRKKDKQEYLQLFRDASWEHVGEVSNWQYFRKEVTSEETPEIFTDVESKIDKYKRVLTIVGFFYIILIAIMAGRISTEDPYPWMSGITVFIFLVLLFMSYAIIKLATRIRQLRKY